MTRALRVAVVCYPTFGGSGVIASEIALEVARRGHDVHVFAYEKPERLRDVDDCGALGAGQLTFHRVAVADYPVFQQAPYALALASGLVELARQGGLDIVHAHYAVPHATSAFLAREVLRDALGGAAPKVVTTLHGTDITLVGSDPSYHAITRFSIVKSDAVTTPSRYLAVETARRFETGALPIEVIPNFVDTQRFSPDGASESPGPREEMNIVHVSNLRPVKRLVDVVAIYRAIATTVPCRLSIVGEGPERAAAEAYAREHGCAEGVHFLGAQADVVTALRAGDLFLLPSELESFGVAALEAMAAGIPVLASDVGGLPEVVRHGETGLLAPVGDIAAFSAQGRWLLTHPDAARQMGRAGRRRAVDHFGLRPAVDRYEALYRRLSACPSSP